MTWRRVAVAICAALLLLATVAALWPALPEPHLASTSTTGVLFAVLDDAGTVAWATGTDLPRDSQGLDRLTASATPGLSCRDLVDPNTQAETGFFDATTTALFGYFLSVVYWFIEGRPDRMDEDGNGIPCETVHAPGVVATVWRGGPVG